MVKLIQDVILHVNQVMQDQHNLVVFMHVILFHKMIGLSISLVIIVHLEHLQLQEVLHLHHHQMILQHLH